MRVGMIGFGGIAQAHRPAWNRPDVELHIIEPNPERRARAETAGIVHDDLGELLDAVEVVDICTPSDLHADLARTAARAGKQVICEKPIALTVDDGADVIRVAREAGVGLYIGHVVRFFGSYSAAHDAVVSGRIGTPSVLQFRRASGQPTANGWMQDESRSGGVPLDLMIHDIDQARWMAGDVVRVYAQGAKPGVGGVKTHVYAVLTHANGALTHITSSWGLAGGFDVVRDRRHQGPAHPGLGRPRGAAGGPARAARDRRPAPGDGRRLAVRRRAAGVRGRHQRRSGTAGRPGRRAGGAGHRARRP